MSAGNGCTLASVLTSLLTIPPNTLVTHFYSSNTRLTPRLSTTFSCPPPPLGVLASKMAGRSLSLSQHSLYSTLSLYPLCFYSQIQGEQLKKTRKKNYCIIFTGSGSWDSLVPCVDLKRRSGAISTFQHIPESLTYMGQTLQHHQKWHVECQSSGASISSMTGGSFGEKKTWH